MEGIDRIAYKVLKRNYTILCSDMDARTIASDAVAKGLLNLKEKRAIWHVASEDGIGAGVAYLLDLLLQKSQDGVFQLFLEVLDKHRELKFWADCLRDEYSKEVQKMMNGRLHNNSTREVEANGKQIHGSSTGGSQEHQGQALFKERQGQALFKEFRETKSCTVTEARDVLNKFDVNVRNVKDPSRKSLLHVACAVMDFRVVKLLVEEYGFKVNDQDSSGNTPLHIACSSQKVQSVMYLVNSVSCDPNMRNNEGLTPLHVTARNGPVGLLKHLLGVERLDTTIKDPFGKTAIETIRNDPQLAASLNKNTSTVSLGLPPGRKTSREEVSRKMSLASFREHSPNLTTETMALIGEGRSVDSEGTVDSPPTFSPTNATFLGVELPDGSGKEFGVPKKNLCDEDIIFKANDDDDSVVLRGKNDKFLAPLERGGGNSSLCCSCCQNRNKAYAVQDKQPLTCVSVLRFCMMGKTLCFLLLGILVGLFLVGGLAYFVVKET